MTRRRPPAHAGPAPNGNFFSGTLIVEKAISDGVIWRAQPGFGGYLRRLREATGRSLRRLAADLAMSPAYLSQLETEVRTAPPSRELLERFAAVFGCDAHELLREAGFRFERPPVLESHPNDLLAERFRRLVLHPALTPTRMDERQIDMLPAIVQRQWIEFAEKLAAAVCADPAQGEHLVARLISGDAGPVPSRHTVADLEGETRRTIEDWNSPVPDVVIVKS